SATPIPVTDCAAMSRVVSVRVTTDTDDLEKALVQNRDLLPVTCERLLKLPSAPLIEPERKVGADPGFGDVMLGGPLLQVRHQRPPYAVATVISPDDHAGNPRRGVAAL